MTTGMCSTLHKFSVGCVGRADGVLRLRRRPVVCDVSPEWTSLWWCWEICWTSFDLFSSYLIFWKWDLVGGWEWRWRPFPFRLLEAATWALGPLGLPWVMLCGAASEEEEEGGHGEERLEAECPGAGWRFVQTPRGQRDLLRWGGGFWAVSPGFWRFSAAVGFSSLATDLCNAVVLFNSPLQQIKKQYRKMALQYHPDKQGPSLRDPRWNWELSHWQWLDISGETEEKASGLSEKDMAI